MGPLSKKEYSRVMRKRYMRAKGRLKKTILLNEFCNVTGYHRKYATCLLKQSDKPLFNKSNKNRGRPSVYNCDNIIKPLKEIWLASNLPCSKRLIAILPIWLNGYQETFGVIDGVTIKRLKSISPSTIDRLLSPIRVKYTKHGRSTTKPGTLLRKQIPIKTNQWDESRPGFLEADTVAHCGESLSGMFVWTVDFVDIATAWTEQRAVWGKGESGVLEQIKDVETCLPFDILGFDSDNGSEFLNHHLLRHFTERKKPVQFTRSRAYHKDDNAHVEQKNWTHVRQWLGYDRLDNPNIVPLLNNLYRNEWRLFHNFFCPSVKLISKNRIGSKTVKTHDKPKTPYQRILESSFINKSTKKELSKQLDGLNPFVLRKQIESKLKQIFSLINKRLG
jgi:hypothetical protein